LLRLPGGVEVFIRNRDSFAGIYLHRVLHLQWQFTHTGPPSGGVTCDGTPTARQQLSRQADRKRMDNMVDVALDILEPERTRCLTHIIVTRDYLRKILSVQ